MLTAAATLLLIVAGGLVTSTGSGLAVPDWPLSYGTLWPPMVGGIFYEHGHRMIAGFVAILTVILAVWLQLRESRRWVRRLGFLAVFVVLLQASLGGVTVLWLLPATVSIAHAGLATAFFCLVCTLATVTSPTFRAAASDRRGSSVALLRIAIVAAIATYIQILLGATMRHLGAGLACRGFPLCNGYLIPPLDSTAVTLHFAHRVAALLVLVLVIATAWRVRTRTAPAIRRPGTVAPLFAAGQICLGILAVTSGLDVATTTAHVAGGALLLATLVILILQAYVHPEPTGGGLGSLAPSS